MLTTSATARLSLAAMTACVFLAACGGDDGGSPAAAAPPPAPAATGITTITINSATDPAEPSQNPAFAGTTFGPVGAYQKIIGTASGTLDPKDPHNTMITDIQLAPKDANGLVDYSMDFYILTPVDPSKGNHKVFFEPPNRGGKQFGKFNGSSGGNNPTTASDPGTAFLLNQGYTLVWGGWEPTTSRTNYSMGLTSPIAKNADGSSITGLDYEYIENDNATTTSYTTAYNTNSTDTTKATLTMRNHLTDTPVTVPPTGWTWTSANTIALLPAGTPFQQSWIYELTFTAKDPVVGGIGFAAIRDFASFLRNAKADTAGTANPLAKAAITRYVTWTLSQPARFMNDFIWLGFNQDLQNKQVFDGVFNWVGAGDGLGLNYRFEQSGRTERNRQQKLYPEAPFPFSYSTLTDPFTGKVDGRDMRCMASGTCPKVMNVISANEYWVKAGSLVHTDLAGNDIPDPANVRNYLISGTQHASPAAANSLGVCQQFGNSVDQNPALRALWVALDQWLDGTPPPPSAVPQRSTGTAVFTATTANSGLGVGTVPQATLGWPAIPNVLYTGLVTVRNLFNFGPQFDSGIMTINPPTATGNVYPSFVSKVDSDGNEIAGIRLPPVSVPVATTAGWNLRSTAFGGPDGCESTGTLVPFAPDAAARTTLGDPRPSLAERYGTHAAYVAAVTSAANTLAAQRLLLPADVQAYITTASQPVSVVGNPVYGSYSW
ncbi:MAG TPA: alpha/beta hydrolase domain-containing protein [Burkholderiaceae bacterium]